MLALVLDFDEGMFCMRIVAGISKGTKLKMVPGTHVRPTSDRVKESVFQMLGPFFSGGRVLDLFAGTGALGLEALSRGMDEAVFVDQSIKSIQTIRHNVAQTKMQSRAIIYKKDAKLACRLLAKQKQKFTLIFIDPPYQQNILIPTLTEIAKQDLLEEDGKIIAELPTHACLPEEIGKLRRKIQRSYGSSLICIYRN